MAGDPDQTTRRRSRAAKRPKTLTIGDYTADLKPLGKGGMATVYLGTAPDGSRVAIKELLPHLRSDRKMVRRFRQEYALVADLEHPNIVRFVDFVEANRTLYIVMERAESSLRAVLKRARRVDAGLAAALGYQLATACAHVHAAGVLHRDLKPANVLLMADGAVKLTDFGIAHMEGTRMTATGIVLGSPAYMAPEQLAGRRKAIDERTDVYALAVVLYECVEGRDPFKVRAREDLLAVLQRKTEIEPAPLRHTDDVDLSLLLGECLAAEPSERPGMDEVAGRLAAIAERIGSRRGPAPAGRAVGQRLLALGTAPAPPARRERRAATAATRPDTVADATGAATGATRAQRRERRFWFWITLGAAVALAAASFLWGGRA